MNSTDNHTNSISSLLQLSGVCKSFAETKSRIQVLKGVSATVEQGDIVTLMGPSGSGKSTLLQIIGCLLKADTGRVLLAGREMNSAGEAQRVRMRRSELGFMFQDFHLVAGLSALDNVALGLRLRRQPVHRTEVIELLTSLGLREKVHKRPTELSGGEKQRVALARALAGSPQLLLADEPTSQLDSAAAGTAIEMLCRSAAEHGTSVIMATHDPRVRSFSSRVWTLKDGKIHE